MALSSGFVQLENINTIYYWVSWSNIETCIFFVARAFNVITTYFVNPVNGAGALMSHSSHNYEYNNILLTYGPLYTMHLWCYLAAQLFLTVPYKIIITNKRLCHQNILNSLLQLTFCSKLMVYTIEQYILSMFNKKHIIMYKYI